LREFLVNIILLVFINLLIKPLFIFGIDLAVQNRAGADYGVYFALLNLSYIFQIVNDFGLQNFNNRNVSQHPQLMPKYFPNFLALKIALSGLYILLTLVLAFTVFQYGRLELPLLLILLFNNVLVQLILFLRSNVSGLGYYRIDSFLSALDKLLMLLTCGALLWVGIPGVPVTVTTFALAQTLALALTAALVFYILRQKIHFPIRPTWARQWRSGWPQVLMLFRKSMPYAITILLMFAYSRFDGVILERLLPEGARHAEVYAGAYRLLDACNMFGYLFATLLLPMFARQLRLGGWAAARPLVRMGFRLIWVGSVTLATLVFFAREPLVHLMMPERAEPYRWEVLGVLIWVFVPVSMMYIFSTLLTAHEQLGRMNRFFILGIVIDWAANALLTPHWQALGAATATLLTHLFVAGSVIGLCMHTFQWRPPLRALVTPLAFAALLVGCGAWLAAYSGWGWWQQSAALLAAAGILAMGLRLVDVREMRQILAAK
jgi:O-antigen/teichoic acid export membrane protein